MRTLRRERRYAVITIKASGARVVFGIFSNLAEAERVVSMLGRIGCTANVEAARGTDAPGLTRKERTP